MTLSERSPFIIGNETIGTTVCKLVSGVQTAGTANELEKQRGCDIGSESEVSFSLLLLYLAVKVSFRVAHEELDIKIYIFSSFSCNQS